LKIHWFMDIWFLIVLFSPLFLIHQCTKGKIMTWREFWFFLFGVFVAGIPFIYVVNQ
jgi:hypothetical protein